MQLCEIKIELTQRCPLACVHCSTISHRKQSSTLPLPTVLRILDEAGELGVTKVVFTGGEPLLYEGLAEVIARASALGIAPTLYTTGIVNDRLESVACATLDSLVSAGVRRFIFSVYSGSASMHESITRYGTFNPTLEAIVRAVDFKVPVEIHFVAMRRNFRDLPGVIELAERLGAYRVSVLRFVPQGRGKAIAVDEDLNHEERLELSQLIGSCRIAHPSVMVRTGSPFNILRLGYTPCNAAQDVLIINHRGEISPCDAFKNIRVAEPKYGSVLKNNLKDVWENSVYLNRVRSLLDGHKGDGCETCNAFDGCRSGCLAQKVLRDGWGATDQRDPGCLVQIQPAVQERRLVQFEETRPA